MTMKNRKDGEHYYAPHRNRWGVWKWLGDEKSGIGTFLGDFPTKEKAEEEVYRLNGWKHKK